ncbi:hypothetical protein [Halopiger goleimassiliensis]|uniref:hypothetical protein n=1 Tax=Halopiger goleimassiliensis TaxID=1293048 RepID=UPI000B12CFAA|nr:hypothetical protein [Halopiger goleimassiliensis]
MTESDDLRRLADVVDAVDETPIDVDDAQLLANSGEDLRAQLTITVPADADLEVIGSSGPVTDTGDEAVQDNDEPDSLDHTSTEDLQQAYDEADGGVHETDDGSPAEDDTNESESEARDVDLEEDAADGVTGEHDDAGDDIQDELDAEAITVDDVGDTAEQIVELPDGVSEDDVHEAVDDNETLGEIADLVGVTPERARTITFALDRYGELRDTTGRSRFANRGRLSPLQTIVLLGLVSAVLWATLTIGVILP